MLPLCNDRYVVVGNRIIYCFFNLHVKNIKDGLFLSGFFEFLIYLHNSSFEEYIYTVYDKDEDI